MKALINNPQDVVVEVLEGFARANSDLVSLYKDPNWVGRAAPRQGVAVVSGGGSGHEPLHAGFVGDGMLDAAVPGPMFTSPTPDAVLAAIEGADNGAGVVCIVKNYTGDVLNFEMAAELAEASGHEVRSVLVADDVAVEDSTFTAGRRGVAGTLLVEKVAGAVAASGGSLDEVEAAANAMAESVRSMGLALRGCTLPHVGEPGFELSDQEVELGVGIHGEPGRSRVDMASADELTDQLMDAILADKPLDAGDAVILLVNGMGATPGYQLDIVFRRVAQRLDDAGIVIARNLVGNYVTSLDMEGVSITIAKADENVLALWDAPVHTPAWRKGC
ncbi:dihydroxyacetone kinase subunit DhaK [Ancrocorticia populi]|uniref:phosphoenolpyruvate--glycerone phosphotransferase n=1 Tax=Ancrocorticia populi TaxID=2175228 RepID=A0A2V1K8C1_9ACTO|nr:dihydroxyacetone kinase subunit DhaK [Ancrocorticia populi]PWF25715.1 dihydroxyacetone kinase subunit DhaK [Ancrocorticia populi]